MNVTLKNSLDDKMAASDQAKILVIGDPHIRPVNIPETHLFIERVVKVVKKYKPGAVVVLGDTLHRFGTAETVALKVATFFLESLAELVFTILLIGNHDLPNHHCYLSDDHAFNANKKCPNLLVVDTRCEIFEISGLKFGAIPYVPPGRMHEALGTNPEFVPEGITAVFAHQEVRGAKSGTYVSDTGDVWPPDYPLLILGHFHTYNRLADNVLYIGSPRQVSFGEQEDKTISLFTFDSNGWQEKRINLRLPRHLTFEVDSDSISKFTLPAVGTRDKIKIIIKGQYLSVDINSHPKIKKWRQLGYKISLDESISRPPIEEVKTSGSFFDILEAKITGDNSILELYRHLVPSS